jgi:Fumarylacetoacetate (FAA) hydrolase family
VRGHLKGGIAYHENRRLRSTETNRRFARRKRRRLVLCIRQVSAGANKRVQPARNGRWRRPSDLARLIEGGPRALEAAQTAFDYLLGQAQDKLGPCIAVGEADATNIDMETLVNGECRQRFNNRDMVFTFGEYLEYLSRDFTLYRGDIISGGTAAGTAADSSELLSDGTSAPERFLKPGDIVEMNSRSVGSFRTRVVAKRK